MGVPEPGVIPGRRQNDTRMAPSEDVASRSSIESLSRLSARRHVASPTPSDSNKQSRIWSLSMTGRLRAGARLRARVLLPLPGRPDTTTNRLRFIIDCARSMSSAAYSLCGILCAYRCRSYAQFSHARRLAKTGSPLNQRLCEELRVEGVH